MSQYGNYNNAIKGVREYRETLWEKLCIPVVFISFFGAGVLAFYILDFIVQQMTPYINSNPNDLAFGFFVLFCIFYIPSFALIMWVFSVVIDIIDKLILRR